MVELFWSDSKIQFISSSTTNDENAAKRSRKTKQIGLAQNYLKQEGWLSPTERESVSAISLRHIIWLRTHESHASMSLPQPFGGCRHLATSRESKAHFGLPWIRPWDNRGKCYMDRKRIQCWIAGQTPRSIYPSIFNHFWNIAIYRWRVIDFQQWMKWM